MKKNLNNITLAICLIIIFSMSIYFIMQKINGESINHYLDFLGGKLMAVISEDKKKEEVAQLYDKFKQQVEEKKVAPGQVEKLAAEILNLENLDDSLRLHKVQETMESALNVPLPDETKMTGNPGYSDPGTSTPHPEDEQKWRELGEHLKRVYNFEKKLAEKKNQKELIDRQLFQYDSNLQVIIDSQLRSDLLRKSDQAMVKAIKELEKQKWLVWKDNYERQLQEQMNVLQDSMIVLKLPRTRINILPGVEVVVPGIDTIKVKITLPPDSLPASAARVP
jgi:hypothetical protein